MLFRHSTPPSSAPDHLHQEDTQTYAVHPVTKLFAIAFVANALDVILSWVVVRHYGLAVEANPLPFMSWGWTHGLVGAAAVKAALLAIVVATAAMQPRYARPLLGLVAVAGTVGAISALIVLK